MSKSAVYLVILCWCAGVYITKGGPVGAPPTGTPCGRVEGATSCVCKMTNGSVVDLTKMARFDGTPRFTDLKDPNNFTYDYNPCIGFKEEGACENVYICQHAMDQNYAVAVSGTEEMWIDKDGTPYAYYTGDDGREAFVYWICDPTAEVPVTITKGDSELYLVYTFFVRSLYACVDLPPPDPDNRCKPVAGAPTCVCRAPDGVIDLTKIASFDGQPRFSNVMDDIGFSYDYNPCAPFSKTPLCDDTHVCQTKIGTNSTYSLGNYETEKMRMDEEGTVTLHYESPSDEGTIRTTIVTLKCDPSKYEPEITTTGDSRIALQYEFTLTSCQCCPGGCSNN